MDLRDHLRRSLLVVDKKPKHFQIAILYQDRTLPSNFGEVITGGQALFSFVVLDDFYDIRKPITESGAKSESDRWWAIQSKETVSQVLRQLTF